MKRTRRGAKKEEESSASASAAGEYIVPNDDVLFEILLRLPARSVLRLRKVCRYWHSLTTDPFFVRKHTRRHCDNYSAAKSVLIHLNSFAIDSPELTLCVLDADPDCNSVRDRLIRMPVKPEYAVNGYPACGFTLRAEQFCDGLLCFVSARGPNPYYICNPLTETWTSVAESLHNRFATNLAGFYFHRPTGEYRLLQYFKEGQPTTGGPFGVGYEVATVNGGENRSWRTVYERRYPCASAVGSGGKLDRLLAADFFNLELVSQSVPIKENLHWLVLFDQWNDDGILVFDTSSEKFRSIRIPFEVRRSRLPALHEIGGNLCIGRAIPFLGEKIELWLLEDYNGKEEWVKMHSILTDQGVTRRPSDVGEEEEEGNMFKRWGRNHSRFSFYDLKRKTCCHTKIRRIFPSCYSTGYRESLVTV